MPRVQMNPSWLSALSPHAAGEYVDTVQRGLRLRVREGRMVWSARYVADDGRHVRFKLGEFPEVGLAEARRRAAKARGAAAGDDDPQAQRREQREEARRRRLGATVAKAIASWLKDKKLGPARWKGGTAGGTARAFLPHIRALGAELGARRLVELTARECEAFVSKPEATATRNRRLQALRLLFGWAQRKALLQADPTARLTKERETERTRTLTDAELAALVRGFDATRYGRAVRLLALTGLRRDEVLGAKWEWFDSDAKMLTLPPDVEKAGRARGEVRRVALSPAAVELLKAQRQAVFAEGLRTSLYVFPTASGERPHPDALKPTLMRLRGRRSNGLPASKDKRAKKRLATLPDDVTIHDVRRTVADALLNRLHVAPWIVDHVVLGHVRPKLLRTYMPTLPVDEAREALDRWSVTLDGMLAAQASQSAKA
jgi:integrase